MIKTIFDLLLGGIKTIYYNICLFGIDGWRLPIIFSNNVKITGLRRGAIKVDKNVNIKIGVKGTKGVQANRKTLIIIGKNGLIHFKGKAYVGSGSVIRVDDGVCTFGNNFSCNKNCFISCTKEITFGEDVLLGWNVNIRDSDGHLIYINK